MIMCISPTSTLLHPEDGNEIEVNQFDGERHVNINHLPRGMWMDMDG